MRGMHMLNKLITRKYINKIVEDLECLNGSDFEQLSYLIGEHYLKKVLQKRGLTLLGHPVGYTLDAYSDNMSECIECSVEKKYFDDFSEKDSGENTKIEKDVQHVLAKSKAPRHIFLFSNQMCTPSQATNLCNYIYRIEVAKCVEISWFDARKISEYIISNMLEDNLLVQKIKDFVPTIEDILMMSINNINMPSLPDNYAANDNLDVLKEKLYTNRCLYIHGIGGIGKSLLSIELAMKIQEDFEALYYVDGAGINSVADLESIELFGTSGRINLLGNLKRPGTLLIIDDLKSDYDRIVNELMTHCSSESCVIVTSQTVIKNEAICFQMNFPSEERSKCILEFNTVECPEEMLSIIKNKTNFHPLLLSLINQMAQELNEWNFVEDELKHYPDFEMDLGVTVCEYLLRHYLPILKKEFDVISWLSCRYINKDLLKEIIGFSGLDKLKRRTLVYETSNCTLKVHDIIFMCIKSVADRQCNYETDFLNFFKKNFWVKNASYYQAIHLHQEKILEIIKREMIPGIALYLYLDIWSNDDYKLIPKISISRYTEECYIYDVRDIYALYSIVQLIECSYKTYNGKWNEKKEYAYKQVGVLLKLIALRNVNKEFVAYVKHHLGKLYVFIQDESAISIFKELIGSNPEMYEAKLQLAKLLNKKENTKEDGERLLSNILDAYFEGKFPSMTVVLATYEEVKNTKNESLIEYYFVTKYDEFLEALQMMALEQFDQPYRVLANVSKIYTYKHPECLRELVKSIPFPSPCEIDIKYAFAIAETYKECGKSILWEENTLGNLEEAKIYFEQAEIFYNKLSSTTNPYKLIMHAENLNKLGKFDKAIELLCNDEIFVSEKNKPFREYRYAESLYGLGNGHYEQALEHINKAIASENTGRYIAAFEDLKACILFEIVPAEDKWKRCFESAIKSADSLKYQKELKEKYKHYLEKAE